jgi:colanic acid biosynthesis glycosyl transferase WcaI
VIEPSQPKIIFVNRFFYPDLSATSQMLSDLAFGLARQGFRIVIVTSRQSYEKPGARLTASEVVSSVRVERVWSTDFGRKSTLGRLADYLSFHIFASLAAFSLTRRGDILVAKTDPPLISIPMAFVARTRGAILVNWLQDLFPEVLEGVMGRKQSPAWLRGLKRLRNRSLHRAQANVVLGRIMARRVAHEGIAGASIQIIENWSDGERVRPIVKADNALRSQWGLQERFVVGYSGNLGVAHEFETMIGAAAQLSHEPNIAFLFVGAGAQLGRVKRAVQERQLANIFFQPYQSQERLAESLSVPDVHLVCLRPDMEGLIVPSKFYGVLAAGRPCIFIGDVEGEVALALREMDCGAAVAAEPTELANAIAALASSPDRLEAMGRRARESFEIRFDRPRAVEKWARLLTALQQQ